MARLLALVALLLALPASASSVQQGILLGRSVEGRKVIAVELGDPSSPRKALVVGCIHGNECAGIAIIQRLRTLGTPRDSVLRQR